MNGVIAEPILRYRVWYQGKPKFEGIGKGFNGLFDRLDLALAQVPKTKAFWNIESTRTERMPEHGGKLQVTIKETVLDKVDVWIEEFKDGYFHQKLTEDGKPWPKENVVENKPENKPLQKT